MVLNNISEKRRTLKKICILIMCVIISIIFASCSNNTQFENKISSQNDNQMISEQESDTDIVSDKIEESQKNPNKNADKKIEKFYVNYGGFKMNVDFDENDINEILEAKNSATVPDVKMKMSLADLIVIYNDDSEDVFGTLYIGEDDCCYLQFANSNVEGAAFKIPDSSFINELF